MTRSGKLRVIAFGVAVVTIVLLVGCKGGNSCEKSLDDYSTADPGTGGGTTPGGGSTPGGGTTPGGGGGGDPVPDDDRGRLLDYINEGRARAGLSALGWDSKMASVAQNYAEYCAAKRAYSPTLSGTPSSRLRGGGVSFNQCDETGVYIDTVTLFINSEVYKDMDQSKLNNPAFTRVGIGYGICHYS
jgi:hypothetical protein